MAATVQVADQFVVLYDMEGWRLSHSFHLRKVHAHISTLQARSPAAAHADATPLLGLSARRGRRAGAGLLLPPATAPEARARAQGCRPWAQETQVRTMQTPKRILLRAPQEHYPERLRAALLVGSALQPQLQPYAFRLQPYVARL